MWNLPPRQDGPRGPCILGTIRDLRFEVGDDEDKNGMELDGWEIGGCPVLGGKSWGYY